MSRYLSHPYQWCASKARARKTSGCAEDLIGAAREPFALLLAWSDRVQYTLLIASSRAVSMEHAIKEVRASAPVEEADIDAELAAGTEEPDLEEEDAAGDMEGHGLEPPEQYAEHEAQHSLASMQHSRGQALVPFLASYPSAGCTVSQTQACALAQAVCVWRRSQA